VLSGSHLINTAVIIVRYFGGIRLGTGGLVKAYSDSVNLVLKSCFVKKFAKLINKELYIKYTQLSQIEYIISKFDISIKDKIFTDTICLKLESTTEVFQELSKELFFDNMLKDIT
ncbi:MAG: putative IMPACT (imprinted ancient) family translation regulator, partial [Arcobacteraceae bacterium]